MHANPLNRRRRTVHVPLIVLSCVFAFPFLWLVLSSLSPREQVGRVPPEWLPRHWYLQTGGEQVQVTPPEPLGDDKLLVEPVEGPKRGQSLLVDPRLYSDGQVTLSIQVADRLESREFSAELLKRIPAHFVSVREWRLSKYSGTEPRTFYVDPGELSRRVEPVLGNYPEAIRALTADEAEKKRPLGELLSRSRMPWTAPRAPGHTITFLTYLANTLVVALLAVFGATFSSALTAYGLARIPWKGRNVLFLATLATMMIPFPVLMIPLYSVFRELGWVGTLKPLWVPAFFGSAFNIFLLRQFFMTIPKELSEAARIDGCSELRIFLTVILPLSRPALTVVALFHFLFVYNDFLGPLIYLTDPGSFTMALGLQQYESQFGGSEWHLLMAASVILVTPVVILFFIAQRAFIEGISTTGFK